MHKEEIPILAIVERGLRQIKLPPLIRPSVANDDPNEELVLWGVKYYAYCVIAHLQTVLRGLVQLIDAKNIPTAFIVCRHVFEWAAHTCYMTRNTESYLKKEEWGRAWRLHSLAMQGNRWIKDHGSKYDSRLVADGVPDPLAVANVVSSYEVYQRQIHGDGDAKDSYGLLSEHSHPNSACFLPYCEYVGREVRFISPSSESSLLGEERCLIDLLMFLEQLLKLGKERAVNKQLVALMEQIAELAINNGGRR